MINIIKLAVGCSSPECLKKEYSTKRINGHAYVQTRTKPKQTRDLLNGGSIYRVINGLIVCRQPIIGFDFYKRDDGYNGTLILVSDEVICVEPRPMQPFQGWRYLKPDNSPPDINDHNRKETSLPQTLQKRLIELGLL